MNEEARQLRESISALEGEKETLKTEAEVKGRHEESAITSASSPPPPFPPGRLCQNLTFEILVIYLKYVRSVLLTLVHFLSKVVGAGGKAASLEQARAGAFL